MDGPRRWPTTGAPGMPDEIGRRRPSFDPARSVPVVFGDGSTWSIPRPGLSVRAVFRGGRLARRPDGRAERSLRVGYGDPDVDALVDLLADADDEGRMIELVATLAAGLLAINYAITGPELDRLLSVRPADPSSWGWLKAVVDVATWSDREG